ncbi:hypothetical protein [uncultured Legionella sp.]|uniref:hypothetical protein n=1 Tax=uncultured Legionella sp. TaxID=210934 RepID=UPI00345D1F3C
MLKEFKRSLEGQTEEERAEIVKTFKSSDEYKLLCTAQGFVSSFFQLTTSSADAVEKIIADAAEMNKKGPSIGS